jgi:hypothetical protein
VPRLFEGVERNAPGSLYARVIGVLNEFLASDFAWQSGTISAADEEMEKG